MRCVSGWTMPFVCLVGFGGVGCNGSDNPRVNAGGATFVKPMMLKWAEIYKDQTGVEIDYQGTGSGNGIQQMTEGTIEFGCSDAPMKKEQVDKAQKLRGEVIHIPVVMGAVAIVYNLPGVDQPLHFTGEVIGDIYLGNITNWNDPALSALNPDANLPDLKINPIYRAESSGTTNIFTEYLSKRNEEFETTIGASKEPAWPDGIGLGQRGNDGIAGFVKSNEGALGYVELTYAKKLAIPFGKVKNRAGEFVLPDPYAVTAAAASALESDPSDRKAPYSLHELTYSLTDREGEATYPIAGMSYAILYKKQPAEKGKVIVEFLKWATTNGQQYCPELDYAPLPEDLQNRIQEVLDGVEYQ